MTVSQQIIEVLNYIGEKIGLAIDWTAENVLPQVTMLCEKFIKWQVMKDYASLCICALMLGIGITGLVHCVKNVKRDLERSYGDDGILGGLLIAFVVAPIIIAGSIWGIRTVFDIIKCTTFPELKMYEVLTELLNK